MPPSNSSTEESYRNNTVFIYSKLGKMHDEFQLEISYDCLIWKESGSSFLSITFNSLSQNETIHKASSETQRKRFVASKVIMSSPHFVADK